MSHFRREGLGGTGRTPDSGSPHRVLSLEGPVPEAAALSSKRREHCEEGRTLHSPPCVTGHTQAQSSSAITVDGLLNARPPGDR